MASGYDAIDKSVNCDVLDRKGGLRNAFINTVAIWRREIKNQVPFSWLVVLGNQPKMADMQICIRW